MPLRTGTPSRTGADDDPVVQAIASLGDEFLDRFNDDYGDAILLVGRHLADRPDAVTATLTGLDRDGIDLMIRGQRGEASTRLDFAAPITDPMRITRSVYDLVAEARTRSGLTETTSFERAIVEADGFRTRLAEVTAVRDIHPHLRSITFGRGHLDTLEVVAPDTFLYLLLPPAGRLELTIDEHFSFEGYASMPVETKPLGAYYTVRHWDAERHEAEMYFVLHDHDHDHDHTGSGTASQWARRATVGDPCALWGPRTSWYPPADTAWYLLVADETGLPAAASILESLPDGVPAVVVAEADGPAERQDLGDRVGSRITWVDRNGAAPGTTTLLADVVRALRPLDGQPYVWGGAESHAMTAIRKFVRAEWGLPREAVSLTGYWRVRSTGAGS